MQVEARTRLFKVIGWGLFAGGMVLLGLTAAMNWFQGDHIGVTAAGKWLNSLSSVTVDVVGIVCIGMAAGACWAARRFTWAVLFTLALILSAGWSVNSVLSFQATERISASKSREAEIRRGAKADKIAEDHVKWTRGTAVQRELSKNERKDLLAASSEEIKKFRTAKVGPQIEPDAGAQTWATITGFELQTVQIGQSGYLALLLIFLKALCFPGAGWFLDPLSAVARVNQRTSGGSPGSGGKSKDGKVVQMPEPAKQPQPLRAEPARTMQLQLPKASSGHRGVFSTDAPTGKLTFDQFIDRVRDNVAHGEPALSTYALAAATGWSQTSVVRHQAKMGGKAKARRHSRRYAGNGGGYHHLAVG